MNKALAAALLVVIATFSNGSFKAKKTKVEQSATETVAEVEREDGQRGCLTRSGGVYYYNGHKETWYSTREKGGQTTARSIPGKHADENGIIRDGDGYICVASSDLAFYSIVETSLGTGKVYDCGCSSGTIDIYTTW